MDRPQTDLETLVAVIARSPIIAAVRPARVRLPANFDDVDIAVLDWIVAEARRASRGLALMWC